MGQFCVMLYKSIKLSAEGGSVWGVSSSMTNDKVLWTYRSLFSVWRNIRTVNSNFVFDNEYEHD